MTGPDLLEVIVFQRRHFLRAHRKSPRQLEIGKAEDALLSFYLAGRSGRTMHGTAIYGMTVEVKNSNGIRVRA